MSTYIEWLRDVESIEGATEGLYDRFCGEEAEVYEQAVGLIGRALNSELKHKQSGQAAAVRQKAVVRIGAYACQLLIGTWQELRRGRGSAAGSMMRGLFETPDYVFACLQSEEFLSDWLDVDRREPIGRARRFAEAFLDSAGGQGAKWRANRTETQRIFQCLPHVSAQSVRSAVLSVPGGTFMTPEGAWSEAISSNGFVVARLALDNLWAVQVAIADYLPESWDVEVKTLLGNGYTRISSSFESKFGSRT